MNLNVGAIVPLCDFKFSNAPDHCRASHSDRAVAGQRFYDFFRMENRAKVAYAVAKITL